MGSTTKHALTKIKGMVCMSKKLNGLNQKGFTLIELISVMIIMGVLTSVSIKKFEFVSDTASERALVAGIKELNIRESLVWSNLKISIDGYSSDAELFLELNTNLGTGYEWGPDEPDFTGGTLSFNSASKTLNRQESTPTSAGKWE
jgi:prepilin-type N-terminal cleavage/methylation domain-containing protein